MYIIGLQSVKPGLFDVEGSIELKDAGKAGLVQVQGKISAVLGTILICAYLFITFFPDQAEKIIALFPSNATNMGGTNSRVQEASSTYRNRSRSQHGLSNVHVDGEEVAVLDGLNMDRTDDLPVSTGLTKRQIARNLNPLVERHRKDKEDAEDCAICLCELEENKRLVVLTCKHKFHVSCIRKWLKKQNVCPLCKCTALRVEGAY
ncbi:rhodanese-like domain-containing protein 9, chloroplastic [Tanacetum coccineum]